MCGLFFKQFPSLTVSVFCYLLLKNVLHHNLYAKLCLNQLLRIPQKFLFALISDKCLVYI